MATSLRGIINDVTTEKLTWLEKQRKGLMSHYGVVLEKFKNPKNKASLTLLQEITNALETCPEGNPADKTIIRDLKTVLCGMQPINDEDALVYFGAQLLEQWNVHLMSCIRKQIERLEYSCMYADVMTKYMTIGEEKTGKMSKREDEPSNIDASGDGTVKTGKGESKQGTISEFERRVLSSPAPEDFNEVEFEELLNNSLFDPENTSEMRLLAEIRRKTDYQCNTCNFEMTEKDLKLAIEGLLQEKILNHDKTITVKELRGNGEALNEVVGVLNKRIRNYATWSWPVPVVVNFKRNIAGRYRAYMDEDILTAVLLEYIGVQWSMYFKGVFKSIYQSSSWIRGTGTLGDNYYRDGSIEAFRREFHEKSFLSVLPSKFEDVSISTPMYDDECEVAGGSRGKSRGGTKSSSTNYKSSSKTDSLKPMNIKQQILHLISNEIHLNTTLRPDQPLTIVQTDMEWFGPSLVHDIVVCVMKYFGVSKGWLKFFRSFLEAPLKLNSPRAETQTRKRGAPISHILTTLFGESLLFVMDLYVNRVSGLSIYRIHDDFWFWSYRKECVTKAWTAMQNFTKLAGLKLNEEKSGSVICQVDYDEENPIKFGDSPLPQRKVEWGFVELHSDGIFRVSDERLAPHVQEMRECLKKAESLMNWIQAHNKYISFFIRNFGNPAKTFGRQHVLQMIEKLKDILLTVHSSANGSAVEAIRQKFPEHFLEKEVMDSWICWPVRSGGLSLYNPFLDLIPLLRSYSIYEDKQYYGDRVPSLSHFASVADKDKLTWNWDMKASKDRRVLRSKHRQHTLRELAVLTISDEEEYSLHRDYEMEYFHKSTSTWERTLPPTPPKDLKKKGKGKEKEEEEKEEEIQKRAVKRVKRVDYNTRCLRYRETRWPHWRTHYCSLLENLEPVKSVHGTEWRRRLYGDQIEKNLGREDNFVDGTLVPLSLISSMQSERVHNN